MYHGGGQVVSVIAFYSHDPSSNPPKVYNFSFKIAVGKDVNKQKRSQVWLILKNVKLSIWAVVVVKW